MKTADVSTDLRLDRKYCPKLVLKKETSKALLVLNNMGEILKTLDCAPAQPILQHNAPVSAEDNINLLDIFEVSANTHIASDEHNLVRLLLESAAHAIMITQTDSSILYINQALERLTGYSRSELIGSRFPYPWWPQDKANEYGHTTPQIDGSDLGRFERCYIKNNGEKFWVITTIKAIARLGDYLIIWEDITDRKKAEEARRVSDDRYRQIFETVTSGIAVYKAIDDGTDFVVKEFNRAAEQATRLKRNKVIDHRVTEVFPGVSQIGLLTVFKQVLDTGNPAFKSACLYSDERLSFWVENQVFLLASGEIVAVFDDVSERKKAEDKIQQVQEDLKTSLNRINKALHNYINATAKMIEMRDPYTAGHQEKVARIAKALAVEMKLPEKQVECIGIAAQVHDIGKIYVPAEILSRSGILTELERAMIKTHVERGYEILKTIEFPWPVDIIVRQHHERMDGSGYPNGLKGKDILLEARIIAVSDTLEAMTAHRPYRPAPGIDKALEEISKNKGILYDADVADACIRLFKGKRFDSPTL